MATISARELRVALDEGKTGGDLAERARKRIGAENLAKGSGQIVDELDVAWVAEGNSPPTVVSELGVDLKLPMKPIGDGLFAAAARLPEGSALRWKLEVGGERTGGGQLETYSTHPDMRDQGAPKGKLLERKGWRSEVFAGTVRDWSIYVPAKLDGPAAVMVFQDGVRMYQEWTTAFDNLVARGDMPPTVGVFVNPGVFADTTVSNRSFEYDTLSDQYTRFVLDEILPDVEREAALREDAASRAICGMSSGGICAFTVAWQRPDRFHKVLSHCGSFANIASGTTLREGGHNYPFLIRKAPPKPIRVFLQDGQNDLNNVHGNWWLANLQMADAFKFAGYDHKLITGQGFHTLAQGRAIFPDSLRWLWRR